MNADFYRPKIIKLLKDESYYQSIPDSCAQKTFIKIHNLIDQHKDLTNQEMDFLTNFEWETSTFYGLPKIHKSKLIQNVCKEFNTSYNVCRNSRPW